MNSATATGHTGITGVQKQYCWGPGQQGARKEEPFLLRPPGRVPPAASLQGAPGRAEIRLAEASPASHSQVQGVGLDLGGTCWVTDLGIKVLP